jgi:hypothetical protein
MCVTTLHTKELIWRNIQILSILRRKTSSVTTEIHSKNVHLCKKNFKCEICDKAFSVKQSLDDHVNRIHKKLKRYNCELCNYTCCLKIDLKRHSIRRHSPKKAHKPDLDPLMKEARKDKMIVSLENITVVE